MTPVTIAMYQNLAMLKERQSRPGQHPTKPLVLKRAVARAHVFVAALILTYSIHAIQCWGFGDIGHLGIYAEAMSLLKALDANYCATKWPERWPNAAIYPDAATTFPAFPESFQKECVTPHPSNRSGRYVFAG